MRAGHRLARLSLILSAASLMVLMGLTVVEGMGRYAFNAPIFGRQDLAQILLACSIFLPSQSSRCVGSRSMSTFSTAPSRRPPRFGGID